MTERADETPFARCERNVVCLRRNTRAIAVTKRVEPTVSVDDSLGPSCGPRSEDDKRGIVRLRLMHGRNGDGIVNDRRTIASQKLRVGHGCAPSIDAQTISNRVRFRSGEKNASRLRQCDDIFKLALSELRILQDRNAAQPGNSKEACREFDRVGHPQKNLVSRCQSESHQAVCV